MIINACRWCKHSISEFLNFKSKWNVVFTVIGTKKTVIYNYTTGVLVIFMIFPKFSWILYRNVHRHRHKLVIGMGLSSSNNLGPLHNSEPETNWWDPSPALVRIHFTYPDTSTQIQPPGINNLDSKMSISNNHTTLYLSENTLYA